MSARAPGPPAEPSASTNVPARRGPKGLTMIELARLAGVPRTTLRFYERRGLLPSPRRSSNGYRVYTRADAVRIRFTKRAQELGFTLEEIAAFLRAADAVPSDGVALVAMGQAKIAEIDTKIEDLRRMQRAIGQRIAQTDVGAPCPILASLGGAEDDDAPPTPPRRRRTQRR